MDIKNLILKVAVEKTTFRHSDISSQLTKPVTRQYLSTILGSMIKDGLLVREVAGRNTTYALPKNADSLSGKVSIRLKNKDLEEHIVWDSLKKRSPVLRVLKENVFSVLDFAFQEMMNNAIEHSRSAMISADIYKSQGEVSFEVIDSGIGVFRNIMSRLKLNSEIEAVQELLKGKTTTHPRGHTGQGIFFTSKIADVFVLDTYDYRLRVDNTINDLFVEKLESPVKGTRVLFKIDANSKTHAGTTFRKYQTDPDDSGAFDKTEVPIRLYNHGTVYISRSQARRVMSGLNKFKSVILDFDKVPTVGQAFADEVFRVWHNRYPEVSIRPINMNEAVRFMVDRVET